MSGFFTRLDALTDANVNVEGKGTLQRFVESLAQDFDENIKPFLDDSHANLIDPRTMLEKYLNLTEFELGNNVLFLGSSTDNRRKVIESWHRYVSIKGTKKAYEVHLAAAGLSGTITEIFSTSGFDSPFNFDSSVRPTFDAGRCSPCSFYILEINGPALTDEILQTIYNIIDFNEPINAKLGVLNYNGTDIINIIPIALISGWDTANDGTLDNNAQAEFLNDVSGTFRSYQWLKNSLNQELTSGTVTIQMTASYPYVALPDEVLGAFTGAIGDSLINPALWSTSFGLFNYMGLTDIVGDEEQFTFTKLLYANNFSKKNANAQEITVSIGVTLPAQDPSEPRTLFISTQQVEGTFFNPLDIVFSQTDSTYYIGQNTGGISQNFTDRFYNTRDYSVTNSINVCARIDLATDNNALGELVYMNSTAIQYSEATGTDGRWIYYLFDSRGNCW